MAKKASKPRGAKSGASVGEIKKAVSDINHALASGDVVPLVSRFNSLSEYAFNLLGAGGLVTGENAPGQARDDFQTFSEKSLSFDIDYFDGAISSNRGFWLLKMRDKSSGSEIFGSLSIAFSESDNSLIRFVLLADRPAVYA
jgi:hypothetical protein